MSIEKKYYLLRGQLQTAVGRECVDSLDGLIISAGIEPSGRNFVLGLKGPQSEIISIFTFANKPDADYLMTFHLSDCIGRHIRIVSNPGQAICDLESQPELNDIDAVADSVVSLVVDYSPIISGEPWNVTKDGVIDWANQFGENALFILKETLSILNKVYLSKGKAIFILRDLANKYYQEFGSWELVCVNLSLLMLQKDSAGNPREDKSQCIIVRMLRDIIMDESGLDILDTNRFNEEKKTVFLYLDDVLASGKTYRDDIVKWLKEDSRYQKVLSGEIRLDSFYFCTHSIQQNNALWYIAIQFSSHRNDIFHAINSNFKASYIITNGRKDGQSISLDNSCLNFIFPIESECTRQCVENDTARYEVGGVAKVNYRPQNFPGTREILFSSPENRMKYEHLIFTKSVDILYSYEEAERKPWFKPLGLTNRTDKSFGLGTLFVSWRNIPNNCPLAFWCQGKIKNGEPFWKPLFRRNNTR